LCLLVAAELCRRKTQGEAEDADTSGVELARSVLPKILKGWEEKYGREYVANLDETGLLWKLLPSWTLSDTSSAAGTKMRKDRMTVVPVVSATGKLLVKAIINKSKRPHAFGRTFQPSQLGVEWYNNAKAWMRADIFSPMMTK